MSDLRDFQVRLTLKTVQDCIGDRYRLTELIGQGGISTVYKATQLGLDKVVAIKVLQADVKDKPTHAARLQLEAKAVASLAHENIARIYDYGETEAGQSFVAMEYVSGPTLAEALARKGALAPAEALPIFEGIAKGLVAAHKEQIIHRDIKPSNVILGADADGAVVPKITDFGLVKVLDVSEAERNKLTQTAEIIGSPSYMSPEQCLGMPVDFGTDIYSFGCLMFETLTGVCPFVGDNVMQTLMQHVHAPRSSLREQLKERVPSSMATVIERCLQVDRKDRYDSMQAVLNDLRLCHQHAELPIAKRLPTRDGSSLPARIGLGLILITLLLTLLAAALMYTPFRWQADDSTAVIKSLRGEVLFMSLTPTSENVLLQDAAKKVVLPSADLADAQLTRISLQNTALMGASFQKANLTEASFSKCGLQNSNFSAAICPGITMSGCALRDADFQNANLQKAKFYKCDWQNSRVLGFKDADLTGAEFTDCEFNYCDLRDVFNHDKRIKLLRCSFVDSDLQGSDFSYADLTSCKLSGANLSSAILRKANLYGVALGGAKLADADLRQAGLDRADLHDAILERADLTGATLSVANLQNAKLAGAVLTDASLFGADLRGANFAGANLTNIVLDGAKLDGANFKGAILPAKYAHLVSGKNWESP